MKIGRKNKDKKMKMNKKKRTFDFCDCWEVRKPKDAFLDLFSIKKKKNGELEGEFWELVGAVFMKNEENLPKEEFKKKKKEEILGEISDSCWGAGRLIAGFFGKEYFNVWFDERHYQKKKKRMKDYGCIRSKNNNGCISK